MKTLLILSLAFIAGCDSSSTGLPSTSSYEFCGNLPPTRQYGPIPVKMTLSNGKGRITFDPIFNAPSPGYDVIYSYTIKGDSVTGTVGDTLSSRTSFAFRVGDTLRYKLTPNLLNFDVPNPRVIYLSSCP